MMRENESHHEDQPTEYVSPWAPREVPSEVQSEVPAGEAKDDSETGDAWFSPHYTSGTAQEDTISFGNPPPAARPPDQRPPNYGTQPLDYETQRPTRGEDWRNEQSSDWGTDWDKDWDSKGWDDWAAGEGPPPSRSGHGSRLLVYVAVAAIAASIGAGVTVALSRNGAPAADGVSARENIPSQHNNSAGSGSNGALNAASVEAKVEPGLVDITSTLKYNSETAEGTGMIVSSDGLVLTNNHVIDQSTSVVASMVQGNRTYRAKVLGYDASDDIALLKLQGAHGLRPVSFGNSDQVSIGTPVLALGNAEGRGGATPAPGIINAVNRSIKANDEGSGGTENLQHMLQTSAQIQQGDSGGALANNAGQVVGMITAANTTSGQADGTIGFAIPINTALSVARQVVSGTPSSTVYIGTPGFLGVILAQSTSSNPQQQASDEQQSLQQNGNGPGFGGVGNTCIENNTQLSAPAKIAPATSGVLIVGDFCGTAISDAGLVPGDVITSVNGQPVTTPNTLHDATASYHPGSVISIGWEDTHGGKHTTPVTLGSGPAR